MNQPRGNVWRFTTLLNLLYSTEHMPVPYQASVLFKAWADGLYVDILLEVESHLEQDLLAPSWRDEQLCSS